MYGMTGSRGFFLRYLDPHGAGSETRAGRNQVAGGVEFH